MLGDRAPFRGTPSVPSPRKKSSETAGASTPLLRLERPDDNCVKTLVKLDRAGLTPTLAAGVEHKQMYTQETTEMENNACEMVAGTTWNKSEVR